MALSSDEQRRCYKYLGYLQVNRTRIVLSGLPESTPAVDLLQAALDSVTPNGETTVRELLVGSAGPPPVDGLDLVYSEIVSARRRFKALGLGTIKLNPGEFDQRLRHFHWLREQLATALDVPVQPMSMAGGGGSSFAGPWREP